MNWFELTELNELDMELTELNEQEFEAETEE